MKNNVYVLAVSCLLLFSCGGKSPQVKVTALKSMVGDNNLQDREIAVDRNIPLMGEAGGSVKVIDVGGKDVYINKDSLVESSRFLPLETKAESLVGKVQDIQFDDNRIFVFDGDNELLQVFDDNGKYLCKIGNKGRGPGEYNSMRDFALDRKEKQVWVHDDAGSKLEVYDYDGRHVMTSPIFYCFSALVFNGDKVFTLTRSGENGHIPNFDKHQITVSGRDFVPKWGILSDDPNPYAGRFSLFDSDRIKVCGSGIAYVDVISPDTLWYSDGSHVERLLAFINGKRGKGFSEDEVKKLTLDNYYKHLDENNVCGIGSFSVSKDFIYADVRIGNKAKNVLYCRSTGHFANQTTHEDLKVGHTRLYRDLWYSLTVDYTDGEKFYKVLQPYNLVSFRNFFTDEEYARLPEDERKMFKAFKEEDNPILLVFKFKEF